MFQLLLTSDDVFEIDLIVFVVKGIKTILLNAEIFHTTTFCGIFVMHLIAVDCVLNTQ